MEIVGNKARKYYMIQQMGRDVLAKMVEFWKELSLSINRIFKEGGFEMTVVEEEVLRMINSYLNEVREYLPENIADDIVEELRTHIIDKAEEMGGLTVRNVYQIIQSLGDPRKLASRYVIGGEEKKTQA